MSPGARTTLLAGPAFIAGMLLLALAACDGGKPPVDPPKPAAIAAPAVKPAPAPAPAPAPVEKPAQPGLQQKADAELTAAVRAALAAEPQVQGFAIDVTASNGVVSLFGTASTKARRDKAGQVAAKVAGVKSVQNNLAIVAGS